MTIKTYAVATAPFEAARKVPILPTKHRSRGLHGHSFIAKARAQLGVKSFADFPGGEPAFVKQRLEQCVAGLDYRYLNDIVHVPTDENLARYLRTQITDIPGIDVVGIQSTHDAGVDLDEDDVAHIWRKFRFEAAHQLPNVPAGHQCGRMHGHSFEVILHARQEIGDDDMAVDFDTMINQWQPLYEQLHLSCLNEIAGLENPTSEIISRWIWDKLKKDFPELSWVTVYETVTAGCHYDGNHFRIWKESRFESAVRLKRAPASDPRHRLHGHSFINRLHLCAPLDEVLGWTVDYGDVKELFKPAYAKLDHQRLDTLEGLEDSDSISILNWLRGELLPCIPQLDRIDLFEAPGTGAFIQWHEDGPALPAQHRH